MKRISTSEIDLVDNYVIHHNGAPFSGVVYEVNANGVLVGEIAVEDGVRKGLTSSWYPSGEKQGEKMYFNNSLHGEGREWYRTGQQRERTVHELGILVESTTWDEQGVIVSSYRLAERDPNYRILKNFRAATWESPSANDASE